MKFLDVTVISSGKVFYEGRAQSVIVPGEEGVFQIHPFHKAIVSRLLPGMVYVDGESFPILHGIVRSDQNKVTALIEPANQAV